MSEQEAIELAAAVKRPKRVYRDPTKAQYIIRCVELENENNRLKHLLEVERAASAKIGFGTLVKRWWRGGK